MEHTKDEFKVKFRGVRGSYPVVDKNYLKYGGNTSCVEVNVGGHLIILDAGTGLIELGNELTKEHIASGNNLYDRKPIKVTLLLSHIHQDHIQGFTFFRPSHIQTTKLKIFGATDYNETLADELAQLLFTKSFPLDLGDIAANLEISDFNETEYIVLDGNETKIKRIEEGSELTPQKDEVIISAYKSYAHPQDGVMIYKIAYKNKSLVYATDKESYLGGDKRLSMFARNCDLLIHDAQYTTEDYLSQYSPKQGYGHSTFDMALEAQKQAGAKKLVFTHFDPGYNDARLDEIAKYYKKLSNTAELAHEGLEMVL
ncbi:MAG: MBL fold metallo-hydrolase [Candidatus Gastranaerophilales bacterium]|nr:MBL fold metallo-hydrolase [Candidatus Gastranaerophilales bacterium]